MASPTTVLALWQAKDSIVETATTIVKNLLSPEHVESIVGPVECKLAPIFPDKETLNKVSDNTKVMVAVTNKVLYTSLPGKTKFQDVQGIFNANLQTVLSPKGVAEQQHKTFTTQDKALFDFKTSDGPSEASVALIQNWVSTELLTDPHVLITSGLDNAKTIRGLITISKSNFDLFSNKVQHESLVADIGFLEYPSTKNETIRISNIKIYVWIKEVKVGLGAIQNYEVGLRGSYFCQSYEPNTEGIVSGSETSELEMYWLIVLGCIQTGLKSNTVTHALADYETFVSEVHDFVKDSSEA
ncbi:hypothetical protein E1B28_009647 [Marasmius oreades]|uniref:Uncharacterized protein n=1 Tax=Marasmius oreades TaxID=181124 RepID=A0A9P7RWZ1_9AGAR|nr:uncharacterized protein E1B28_009647 [Marasmius oreades]KAG7090538.1 hypothetical protein E1B28_009647 [Marasmius oreades]